MRTRVRIQGELLTAVVFLTLGSGVGVYLMMVSAARTNLYTAPGDPAFDVVLAGFPRFHFFWIALLWPWVAAAAIQWAPTRLRLLGKRSQHAVALAAVLVPLAFLAASSDARSFDYARYYRDFAQYQGAVYECIEGNMSSGQRAMCPVLGMDLDLTDAVLFGMVNDASFARHLTLRSMAATATVLAKPLDDVHEWTLRPEIMTSGTVVEYTFPISGNVPVIPIEADHEALSRCLVGRLSFEIRPERATVPSVYFTRMSEGKAEAASAEGWVAPLSDGGWTKTELIAASLDGFGVGMAFYPVSQPQSVGLRDVELRCLLERPF